MYTLFPCWGSVCVHLHFAPEERKQVYYSPVHQLSAMPTANVVKLGVDYMIRHIILHDCKHVSVLHIWDISHENKAAIPPNWPIKYKSKLICHIYTETHTRQNNQAVFSSQDCTVLDKESESLLGCIKNILTIGRGKLWLSHLQLVGSSVGFLLYLSTKGALKFKKQLGYNALKKQPSNCWFNLL